MPDGLALQVRLTPKSSRDEIDGVETGADGKSFLKARVRAVPEKGKANKALIALLAKQFGIAKSAVRIVSGDISRLKSIRIECAKEQAREIAAILESL